MSHDSGTNTQPVVELDVLSTNSAILCPHERFSSLLYEELSNLNLNPVIVLPMDSMSTALPYVFLSELENETPLPFDYLFVVFPSFYLNQDQLAFILRLAARSNIKAIIIDSQLNTKSFQIDKLLQKNPDLDYRLCLVKDYYSDTPSAGFLSPLEQFISKAKHGFLPLKYPQKNFYPTSIPQIIQGSLKATFKFSSYKKTFHLSVLDSITQIELANHLKNYIQGLQIEEIAQDKPLKDISQKQIVSTQAELDWYPDNELTSYLSDMINSLPVSDEPSPVVPTQKSTEQIQVTSDLGIKPIQQKSQAMTKPIIVSRLGDSLFNDPIPIKTYQLLKPKTIEQSKDKEAPVRIVKNKEGSLYKQKQLKPISESTKVSKSDRVLGISRRGFAIASTLFVIIFLVCSPLIGSIYLGILAVNSLKAGLTQTGEGQYQKSQSELIKSTKLFSASRTLLTFFVPTKVIFSEKVDKYDRLLDSASKFVPIAQKSNLIRENTQKLYEYVIGKSETQIDYETVQVSIKDDSEELYNSLVNLDFSLQKQDFDSSFADFQKLLEFKNSIPKVRRDLKRNLDLLNSISLFLNTPDTKNYLLLVQNTSELRPTGGFIEVAGVITVKNGQILDYAYSDVYSLDQRLQGFVPPPSAIKKYLGEPNWFLRDSNWNPDFAQSATQAIWFYEKESDRRVDGVISIDTDMVKALLEVLGPVELKNWDLVINHTNIYEKLLYQPKKDPEPGQEARYLLVDVLSSLTERLLSNTDAHLDTTPITQFLDEVHLQLFLKNPVTQKQIGDSSFAGTILDRPCFSKFIQYGCVSETFSLNEANVGINKVNYFIRRSIDQETNISSGGQISHKITINYENSSPSTAWPGGDYKTYTRFSAPLGSQILAITQDGQPVGLEDTKASSTLGLAEFTFPLTVKAGKTSEISIIIRSPRILNLQSPQSALSVNWEKQSGTTVDPLRLSVTYPELLKVTEINQNANVSPGRAQFLDQFASDQTYALLFASIAK